MVGVGTEEYLGVKPIHMILNGDFIRMLLNKLIDFKY